jgi:hypothetical protein
MKWCSNGAVEERFDTENCRKESGLVGSYCTTSAPF